MLLSFSFPLQYSGLGWVEGGLLEYSKRCFSLKFSPFLLSTVEGASLFFPLFPLSPFQQTQSNVQTLSRRRLISGNWRNSGKVWNAVLASHSTLHFCFICSSVQEIGFCFIYAAMQYLDIPRWCCHFHPYTAILDIANVAFEITITMLADGKDGYGGQCGSALQHHLLPLLPRHHRLPRTPGQQVPFFLLKKQIGRKLCLGISSICSPSTTSCTRSRASSTAHCKLTPTNQDPYFLIVQNFRSIRDIFFCAGRCSFRRSTRSWWTGQLFPTPRPDSPLLLQALAEQVQLQMVTLRGDKTVPPRQNPLSPAPSPFRLTLL